MDDETAVALKELERQLADDTGHMGCEFRAACAKR